MTPHEAVIYLAVAAATGFVLGVPFGGWLENRIIGPRLARGWRRPWDPTICPHDCMTDEPHVHSERVQ